MFSTRYGEFNMMTSEWTDGILAVTIRRCVENRTPERKWVVFDGPVDAVWIENMNTVLDDNKKLCLANSEIIKLSDPMTMMFEVEDLAVASPATVSRCGMVFLEPKQMGWRPLFQSWLNKLPPTFDKFRADITALFEWAVPPLITLTNKFCKPMFPLSTFLTGMQPVTSCMHLFQAQCDDFFAEKMAAAPDLMQQLEGVFFFSLIWSFGSNLDVPGRQFFSEFLRKFMTGKLEDPALLAILNPDSKIAKSKTPIPEKGLVFDYQFIRTGTRWEGWMESAPVLKIAEGTPFYAITVWFPFGWRLECMCLYHVSRHPFCLSVRLD